MECTTTLHIFETSQNHEFNPITGIGGNANGFPYGGPGFHTCNCGEKWIEEKEMTMEDHEIKEGTMIHDILSKKHLTKPSAKLNKER